MGRTPRYRRKHYGEWAKDNDSQKKRLKEIQKLIAQHKEKTPPQWYVNGQGQTMVVIPGSVEFLMGSPPTEKNRIARGERQHKRRIGRPFALCAAPVTVAQYKRFVSGHMFTKRHAPDPICPVIWLSWYQAASYCNWLSQQEGIPEDQWCYETDAGGKMTKLKAGYLRLTGYRLPTEAEWEFAARAGAVTARYYGETDELLGKYGWYIKNAKDRSWPVGLKKPNDLGLFDMHGNVWNWCQDRFLHPNPGPDGRVEDKEESLMIISTQHRGLRGGSFSDQAAYAAARSTIKQRTCTPPTATTICRRTATTITVFVRRVPRRAGIRRLEPAKCAKV